MLGHRHAPRRVARPPLDADDPARRAEVEDALAAYLASEQGRDVAQAVAVRLGCLPWRELLGGRAPGPGDVHLVRGIIERNQRRRAAP